MFCFLGRNFNFELGKRTYIMGILNITPDSFSDGGLYNDAEKALEKAFEMQAQGADIIDIGAQSTRPGSVQISDMEEIGRLSPILKNLKGRLDIPISVDTYYPKVAQFALENGASVINDVSSTVNPHMADLIKAYDAGWIIMHTGGSNANEIAAYDNGVVYDVCRFFEDVLKKIQESGLKNTQICLDMGIGFGKSHEDNLALIRNIHQLKRDDVSLLTALSRKRVIGQATDVPQADQRLYGTIAANTAAIAGKTDFIRVHDVRESVEAAKMADKIYRGV